MPIDITRVDNLDTETTSTSAAFVYFDDPPAQDGPHYTRLDMQGVIYRLIGEMTVTEFRVIRQRLKCPKRSYGEIGNSLHETRQAVHKAVNGLRRRKHPASFLFD